MKFIAPIILCLSVAFTSFAQTLSYEVVKGNKDLGDMKVTRKEMGDGSKAYEIESTVVFKLLFSFTIDFYSESRYEDGVLQREYTINKLSGKTQKESTLTKNGDDYQLILDGFKSYPKGPINYSVTAIYFEEPEDGQKVFSPQFGRYLTFKEIGDHQYEMESPDGTNEYYYLNGICTEVKVFRDFAKFSFIMNEETLYAVKGKKISAGGGMVD